MPILLDAERISASRPDRPLFTDLSLTVSDGDRIGVVGINGAGKSTLLRMLGGELLPETGTVRRGNGVRVGFAGQHPVLPAGTVTEVIGGTWQSRAMLDRLGMSDLAERRTDELSGGQIKRVALVQVLANELDCLILDEPTNHLDLDAIQYLEEWLADFRGGLVMVTHDRHTLDRVTTKVLEIDRGSTYLHVPSERSKGSGYAAYLAGRAEREERAAADEQTRRTLAARELVWLRRGAPARTSKPKARIDAALTLINTRQQAAARQGDLGLNLGTKRLGNNGIELLNAAFTWPDGSHVLNPLTATIEPGDRIGIVGPNGAGKSTLLDLIAGRLHAVGGEIRLGKTVHIGYYDQMGRALPLDKRVREVVAGDKVAPSYEDAALMRRFWFDGDAQFAPIGTLSGGERRRLQLMLTLLEQPNVLLLDEPTNDLDLDTLRALEDFLDTWKGIVVTVSHDRAFLDRVTDELLALDGNGGARWIRGGIAAWLAERANPEAGATSPRKVAAQTAAPKPAVTTKPTGRSGSTLRRLVAQTERELAAVTKRRDELVAQLSGESSPSRLGELGAELTAVQARLDATEATWLELHEEADDQGIAL